MSVVVSYLRRSYKALALIIILLIVKVIADLTLPFYTANIVNIGIQQGGIESIVPQVISSSLLQSVLEDADAQQRALVLRSYHYDDATYTEGSYLLHTMDASLEPVFLQSLPDESLQSPNIRRQAAIAAIRADQARLGVDLNSGQLTYIGSTGLKMIGISLLSVVASILVAFYASRIAAQLGRHLRS